MFIPSRFGAPQTSDISQQIPHKMNTIYFSAPLGPARLVIHLLMDRIYHSGILMLMLSSACLAKASIGREAVRHAPWLLSIGITNSDIGLNVNDYQP